MPGVTDSRLSYDGPQLCCQSAYARNAGLLACAAQPRTNIYKLVYIHIYITSNTL